MLWGKISVLLPLELKAWQFSKTHDASCILDTYISQIVCWEKIQSPFSQNWILRPGIRCPWGWNLCREALKGAWDDSLFKAESSLIQVLFKSEQVIFRSDSGLNYISSLNEILHLR